MSVIWHKSLSNCVGACYQGLQNFESNCNNFWVSSVQSCFNWDNQLRNDWKDFSSTFLKHIEDTLNSKESIWIDLFSDTLEERLLEAAFFHSKEKHVTVIAPCTPRLTWRRLAKRYGKKIIHIPLKRFSNQTIEKTRRFHVLNGKNIRSYAQRFIQDL